jgi:serine phosphatase RsbU (regulator of sigma subunit)
VIATNGLHETEGFQSSLAQEDDLTLVVIKMKGYYTSG